MHDWGAVLYSRKSDPIKALGRTVPCTCHCKGPRSPQALWICSKALPCPLWTSLMSISKCPSQLRQLVDQATVVRTRRTDPRSFTQRSIQEYGRGGLLSRGPDKLSRTHLCYPRMASMTRLAMSD